MLRPPVALPPPPAADAAAKADSENCMASIRKSLCVSADAAGDEEEEEEYEYDDGPAFEVGWPTNVKHVAHVTFDRFKGFMGVPADIERDLPRSAPSARCAATAAAIAAIAAAAAAGIAASLLLALPYAGSAAGPRSRSVFGVHPESMQCLLDDHGNMVPTILMLLQARLYNQGGLKKEGIFRITAGIDHEEQVRAQLNAGVVPNNVEVHALAGLIKAWFRELPEGVLDKLSPEQVADCQDEAEVAQLITTLPATQAALLDWTINLMTDVVEHEKQNKMNARNIAMVFAPNMTLVDDPLTALMHAVQVMNFLKTLILRKQRLRREAKGLSVKGSQPSSGAMEPVADANGGNVPPSMMREVTFSVRPHRAPPPPPAAAATVAAATAAAFKDAAPSGNGSVSEVPHGRDMSEGGDPHESDMDVEGHASVLPAAAAGHDEEMAGDDDVDTDATAVVHDGELEGVLTMKPVVKPETGMEEAASAKAALPRGPSEALWAEEEEDEEEEQQDREEAAAVESNESGTVMATAAAPQVPSFTRAAEEQHEEDDEAVSITVVAITADADGLPQSPSIASFVAEEEAVTGHVEKVAPKERDTPVELACLPKLDTEIVNDTSLSVLEAEETDHIAAVPAEAAQLDGEVLRESLEEGKDVMVQPDIDQGTMGVNLEGSSAQDSISNQDGGQEVKASTQEEEEDAGAQVGIPHGTEAGLVEEQLMAGLTSSPRWPSFYGSQSAEVAVADAAFLASTQGDKAVTQEGVGSDVLDMETPYAVHPALSETRDGEALLEPAVTEVQEAAAPPHVPLKEDQAADPAPAALVASLAHDGDLQHMHEPHMHESILYEEALELFGSPAFTAQKVEGLLLPVATEGAVESEGITSRGALPEEGLSGAGTSAANYLGVEDKVAEDSGEQLLEIKEGGATEDLALPQPQILLVHVGEVPISEEQKAEVFHAHVAVTHEAKEESLGAEMEREQPQQQVEEAAGSTLQVFDAENSEVQRHDTVYLPVGDNEHKDAVDRLKLPSSVAGVVES
eukprot:SM000075S21974  [mRNA]  locus=s75:410674:415073:+ [translate_table: standard]